MRRKSARTAVRNARLISLALAACLFIALIFNIAGIFSKKSAVKKAADETAALANDLRYMTVQRLERQSDIYYNCSVYLSENQTTAMSAYLSGVLSLTANGDVTDKAWADCFPDFQEMRNLCSTLNESCKINADALAALDEEQRTTLSGIFQQLADLLDRNKNASFLGTLISAETLDKDACTTEINKIDTLISQAKNLLNQAQSAASQQSEGNQNS